MPESKLSPTAHPAVKPVLGAAGESSDPVVHQLLAELQAYESVEDAENAKVVRAKLADLGWSA